MILQESVIAIRVLRKLHLKNVFPIFKAIKSIVTLIGIYPTLMSTSRGIYDISLQK